MDTTRKAEGPGATAHIPLPASVELLYELCARWRYRLMLGHWAIDIRFVQNLGDCRARIDVSPGLEATLKVDPTDETHATWPGFRRSVVHELVHLWTNDMAQIFENVIGALLPEGAQQDAIRAPFTMAHEKAVDAFVGLLFLHDEFEDADLRHCFEDGGEVPKEAD